MEPDLDFSALPAPERRAAVARLAESGLLKETHIARLAALGDELSLLQAAERLKGAGYEGFEYQMARYELERKSPVEVRVPLLEAMLRTSYHRRYMVELAGLYCAQGEAGKVKARRVCARLKNYFVDGREVTDAAALLALLERGEADAAFARYGDYADPAPKAPAPTPAAGAKTAAPKPRQEKPQPPAPSQAPAKKPVAKASGLPGLPPEVERAFQGVIGMREVKVRLAGIYHQLQLQREREARLKVPMEAGSFHFVLLGNPGTGKTTVARILAGLLHDLGVRESDKLVETDRSGLVSQYVGETALKTQKVLESALGGTLFIDEAYTLYKEDNAKDTGQEAIDTILKFMEDHRTELTVILAGYKTPMEEMFRKSNPGFASRFQYHITLPDYTDEELLEIAERTAQEKRYVITEEARAAFLRRVERERVGETFGNARAVRTILDKAVAAQGARVVQQAHRSKTDLMLLLPQDFEDPDVEREDLDALLLELDGLTGLEGAKAQVRTMVKALQARKLDEAQGISHPDVPTLHTAFLGNPGTGKTTVARILGRIYRSLGVLKRGEVFVECTRADLVSQNVGGTAPKTREVVQRALGGILFLDEAYDLCRGSGDGPGQEAVNTLIAEMENRRDSLMIILAGYTKEMDDFFSTNPGLRSRVPNQVRFDDYSKAQLMDIFASFLGHAGYTLEPGWEKVLEPILSAKLAAGGWEFANARGARNLAQDAIGRRNLRVAEAADAGTPLGPEEAGRIIRSDLTAERGDRESADALLAQLDALTGLASVKAEVHGLVKALKARQLDRAMGLNRADGMGTLHMAFLGNPGTGKTTVARLLGKLYTALGVLPGGPLVECSRADLVAGYQGQTAPKVKALVKEAMGGVLFIDEAYSLCTGPSDTFGHEAVDTLLQEMENHRDGLMVILAGYTGEMEAFLSSNPGLRSRVPTKLTFEDYDLPQLLNIFQLSLTGQGFTLPAGWEGAVTPALETRRAAGKDFANAREARNLADAVLRRRDGRIADAADQGHTFTPEEARALTLTDLTG